MIAFFPIPGQLAISHCHVFHLGHANLICGLASGPRPGSRSFDQKKHSPVNEKNITDANVFTLCFVPHEKNIPVVNEKNIRPFSDRSGPPESCSPLGCQTTNQIRVPLPPMFTFPWCLLGNQ
jgi:hypothetical protein